MPVRIEKFEEGDLPTGPSVPEEVVLFLMVNRDKAFTRSEIATAIDADPNTVGTALSRLKRRELVRHKGEYWAITDNRKRISDAYDLHQLTEQLNKWDGGIDPAEWDSSVPDEPHPSEARNG